MKLTGFLFTVYTWQTVAFAVFLAGSAVFNEQASATSPSRRQEVSQHRNRYEVPGRSADAVTSNGVYRDLLRAELDRQVRNPALKFVNGRWSLKRGFKTDTLVGARGFGKRSGFKAGTLVGARGFGKRSSFDVPSEVSEGYSASGPSAEETALFGPAVGIDKYVPASYSSLLETMANDEPEDVAMFPWTLSADMRRSSYSQPRRLLGRSSRQHHSGPPRFSPEGEEENIQGAPEDPENANAETSQGANDAAEALILVDQNGGNRIPRSLPETRNGVYAIKQQNDSYSNNDGVIN